jgi:hypothetical protein
MCDQCGNEVIEGQGLPIKTETDELFYFCKSCLIAANKRLSLLTNRTTDQQDLLEYIREFLKHGRN